jgi:hypothetical protein
MKLVDNWKRVALYSYTIWAQVFGLIVMWTPEVLFLSLGYDVASPLLWFVIGTVLLVLGISLRFIKQSRISG